MSKPSRDPLDNFDLVSPYAEGWARDRDAQSSTEPAAPRPVGIETDHDAQILDEIEASLRAMIEINHTEPAKLTDVSRAAAAKLSQELEQQRDEEADRDNGQDSAAPHAAHQTHQFAADMETVRDALHDPRTPPWLLSRAIDTEPIPEPVDEHWPRPKNRNGAGSKTNKMFLRFGLAATGAAIVAVIAIKDIPSVVMNTIGGPISELSTNAAAVFNEGRTSPLQARMDAVQKEQERAGEPGLRFAVANADPQARPIAVKTEPIGRAAEPRRETVMTPWPAPETTRRQEPAGGQPSQPAQQQAQPPVETPAASSGVASENTAKPRSLSNEEIAVLRKMGDDYISSGDFVGARSV
ncbi:MAG TPA: hypothetical protein VNZ93_23405, partial [Pseudorhodoplanes sp.]|nr:hypothetical protein [Pseudorhodoplanes sp.]